MNTQEAHKRPLWRRIARGFVIAVAVLFLIALTARAIWGYVEAKRVNAEVAKIRAAGEPLMFKDLDAGEPRLSEADDAGPYYEAALALLRDKDSEPLWDAWHAYGESLQKAPTSRPSQDITEKVDKLLADNAAALEMLDQGAKRPGCRFDIGIEYGMERCLERLSRTRAAAKLLSGRALARAAQGKGDEAADSLICLLRFQRVFDRRPLIIDYLMKIACTSLACTDAGTVIEISRPSDAALARLEEALLATQDPRFPRRMVLAERVYALQLMRDLIAGHSLPEAAGDTTPMPGQWPTGGFWGRPMMQRLTVGGLRLFAAVAGIAAKPLPEALAEMRRLDPSSFAFGEVLQPSLTKVFVTTGWASADVGCAAAAVAVQRYRRARGKLPATLSQLVPEYIKTLPSDPFTGKDLLYHHDENSYVVYSVGENGQDDGGQIERDKKSNLPPDIGIRVRMR